MPRKATAATPLDDPNDYIPPRLKEPGMCLLAIDSLYLHPLNTRSEPPDAEIAAMAASIKSAGLIHNLSGYADNGDSVGIVAGGRRLRALQLLHANGDWQGPIPVQVTTSDQTAREWAGAENEARTPLHPADEVRAYAQLRDTGADVPATARAFAVTESHVRQRLALSTLPPQAIDALRAGKISLDTARALTAAGSPPEALSLLKAAVDGRLSTWQLREKLEKDALSLDHAEAAYLGVAEAEAAGIRVTRDLFAEKTYLHGREQVQALARAKALAKLEQVRQSEGWAWCDLAMNAAWGDLTRISGEPQTLPDGDAERYDVLNRTEDPTPAECAELDALDARLTPVFADADRARAGILGHIHRLGLEIDRAHVRRSDAAPPPEPEDDTIDMAPKPPEATMPQNLRDDLRAIRLAALQVALSDYPLLLRDLLAIQLSGQCNPWEGPFEFGGSIANTPEKLDGTTLPKFLAKPETSRTADPTAALTAQKDLPGSQAERVFAQSLARHYRQPTGDLAENIAAKTGPQVRAIWTPTAAGFLGRVSSGYLDTLWCTLVPDEGSRHDGFRSLTKKEKARELEALFADLSVREAMGLSRDQNAVIDAWLPEELRFAAVEGEA